MSCYLAELDFPHLGGVSEQTNKMVHERAGHIHEVACAVQPAECGVRPQVATYPCQGVGEVRGQPGISSGLANRGAGAGQRSVRLQGHQGDESQEGRGVRRRVSLRPLTVHTASSVPLVCHLRAELRPARPAVYEFSLLGSETSTSARNRL